MGLLFCLSALLHLLLSIFLFHNVVTHSFSAFLQPSCHDGERAALLQFKQSFIINKDASFSDGAYPKVLGWKAEGNNSNCCSWDGVECDAKKGHVNGLDLSSSCLFGSISSNSTLFLLSHLKKLNLADNNFNHSPIPPAIGNFLRMTYLNLSLSVFRGQIPSQISQLSKLKTFPTSCSIPWEQQFDWFYNVFFSKPHQAYWNFSCWQSFDWSNRKLVGKSVNLEKIRTLNHGCCH
ncbi:hypothetical protein UlMin_006544 [Ulmus minor]